MPSGAFIRRQLDGQTQCTANIIIVAPARSGAGVGRRSSRWRSSKQVRGKPHELIQGAGGDPLSSLYVMSQTQF